MINFQGSIDTAYRECPDTDFLLVSHEISRDLHEEITKILDTTRRKKNCSIFLTTRGGDPHAGFRIARALQHYYKNGTIRIIVPSFCKSAGTLMAIGATELAIGDQGELGPLDVQVSKHSEILERGSGLDYTQALSVALEHAQKSFSDSLMQMRARFRFSTKMAGELATQLARGTVEPLYAQIDPNRIGEMQRAIQIAHEYGQRLNNYSQVLQDGALKKLVAGYPSHSFVIDRKEAKDLFKKIQQLTSYEDDLIKKLWFVMREESELVQLLNPTPPSADEQTDVQSVPVDVASGTENAPVEPEEAATVESQPQPSPQTEAETAQ